MNLNGRVDVNFVMVDVNCDKVDLIELQIFFHFDMFEHQGLTNARSKFQPRHSGEKVFIDFAIFSIGNYFKSSTRPRGYKTFSMLNSVEHEISNAHKYKNIKKFGFN